MTDENTETTEEETPPSGVTLGESDYDNIADRLFDKSEKKKQLEKEEKERKQQQQQQGAPVTAEVKLTDEDRKGIASYLHELNKEETDAADKDKKQKDQDKKDQKDSKPQPQRHVLDRPLFSIGGGRRAS